MKRENPLSQKASESWTVEEARHLLMRAGFGGSPEQVRLFHARGRVAAVEWLLAGVEGDQEPVPPPWVSTAEKEATADQPLAQGPRVNKIVAETEEKKEELKRMAQREFQQQNRKRMSVLGSWWLERLQTTGASVLREKLTLFWHGHFATSMAKVQFAYLLYQQNALLRRHALGNVQTLTQEISRDPAMMMYLDTQRSHRQQPNENFAREVMELFTLGEGHYTEQDIKEAARAFTGYRVDAITGKYRFQKKGYDPGEKTIFGQKQPFTGNQVIELIFAQEQCARYLLAKLWRFFVHEQAEEEVVNSIAKAWQEEKYEMKPLLRALFLSELFYRPSYRAQQIKSPVQFLTQVKHELEVEALPTLLQLGMLQQLEQVLFRPPNVAGWEGGRTWITTNSLLNRYNIAGYLIKGPRSGYRPPGPPARKAEAKRPEQQKRQEKMMERIAQHEGAALAGIIATTASWANADEWLDTLIARFFHQSLPAETRASYQHFLAEKKDQPLSTEIISDLIHLMLSTPHYQLC
jgi:uncharacterized protein (DUF1800 family)